MKVNKLRILTGGDKCNADCPYCITKMVAKHVKKPSMNWKRFSTACNYANRSGAATVILGGIGEPTLYPECVTETLEALMPYDFPIIEMETNGSLISQDKYNKQLREWSDKGMTTIQISILNYDSETNIKTMKLPYYNIGRLVSKLHDYEYSVRLSCVLFKQGIESPQQLEELINYALKQKAEQLIIRPVTKPYNPTGKVLEWVKAHELTEEDKESLRNYLDSKGERIHKVGEEIVYDVFGQTVINAEPKNYIPIEEDEKQLTLFPKGTIRYDRRYKGSVLL
ncbi:MAG: radical SAM protein [Nanoarchaeota archaeon]|nr:radical SAM protein [Nanoarchaeota archaeon]